MYDLTFFVNCIMLAFALAADAFSVSLANGLTERDGSFKKAALIAGVFGFFQFLMPLIGWVLVKTFVSFFTMPKFIIPLAALLVLGFLGVKMIIGGVKDEEVIEKKAVGFIPLLMQGVATSLDALSVGLTISDYGAMQAFIFSLIIGAITFLLCIIGVKLGNNFKNSLSSYANVIGGIILIVIGAEIFIRGII